MNFNIFKFEPDGYQAWQKHIDAFNKKARRTEVTHVSFLLKGGKFLESGNHACHAGMSGAARENEIEYVVSSFQKPSGSKEEARALTDFFVNISPWKHVHLEKDLDKIIDGSYILDASLPNCYVVQAAIETRFISEIYNQNNAPIYYGLINEGVKPEFAYLTAKLWRRSNSKTTFEYAPATTHISFHPSMMNKDQLNRWLKHDYEKEASYKKLRRLTTPHTWGTIKGPSLGDRFALMRPEVLVKIENRNIFEAFGKKKVVGRNAVEGWKNLASISNQIERLLSA